MKEQDEYGGICEKLQRGEGGEKLCNYSIQVWNSQKNLKINVLREKMNWQYYK